jgi:hypothetical protein
MLEKIDFQNLLRRVGNIEQLAGIRRISYTSGRRDGIRAFEVYNAAGLQFNVMESRCLDIFNVWYKGTPFAFVSKPGMVAAAHADLHGVNFLRSGAGAGLVYTCGLTNVGPEYRDDNAYDIFHGRIRFIAPENAGSTEEFKDGDYVLKISGEMREASLFGEHLTLSREIFTSFNSTGIEIKDIIENRGFEEKEFMIMYHMNCGYPVIDEGVQVFIPSSGIKPMNPPAEKAQSEWDKISGPVDGQAEHVFVHSLRHDKDGMVYAGVYNPKLKLGIYNSFAFDSMNYLVEWKSMMSGDYVLGLSPANNHAAGRAFERSNGTLRRIKPFEKKPAGMCITVIDGEEALAEFRKKFEGCIL